LYSPRRQEIILRRSILKVAMRLADDTYFNASKMSCSGCWVRRNAIALQDYVNVS
jgi:hypothetical protein